MKESERVDLKGYVKVEFLDMVMLHTPTKPVAYLPTLMFKDKSERALAIPIAKVKYPLAKEILEEGQSIYRFFSEALKTLGHLIEGSFIYDLEETEAGELKYLSKLVFKNLTEGKLEELEGDVSDVILMALSNKVPIYVKEDVMITASAKLPQDFDKNKNKRGMG